MSRRNPTGLCGLSQRRGDDGPPLQSRLRDSRCNACESFILERWCVQFVNVLFFLMSLHWRGKKRFFYASGASFECKYSNYSDRRRNVLLAFIISDLQDFLLPRFSGPSLVVPSSQYYLRSLSWTSRTFYFLDSRDLLEVLRGLSWQRERPLGRESLPCPHVRDLGKLVFCSQELTFAHIRSCPCRVCYGVVA